MSQEKPGSKADQLRKMREKNYEEMQRQAREKRREERERAKSEKGGKKR